MNIQNFIPNLHLRMIADARDSMNETSGGHDSEAFYAEDDHAASKQGIPRRNNIY